MHIQGINYKVSECRAERERKKERRARTRTRTYRATLIYQSFIKLAYATFITVRLPIIVIIGSAGHGVVVGFVWIEVNRTVQDLLVTDCSGEVAAEVRWPGMKVEAARARMNARGTVFCATTVT